MNKEYAVLKDILWEARERYTADIIAFDPSEHVFSPSHASRMKKILKNAPHKACKGLPRPNKRLIALLIAAAMVIFGGLTVYAHGDQVVRFVKEVFSSFNTVSYESDSDVPEYIETEYTMEYVPEGYEKSSESIDDAGVWIQWTREEGEEIIFKQGLINTSIMNNDNEHSSDEHIQIGEFTVYHISSDTGYCSFVWTNNEYTFRIASLTPLSLEEATKMIESVNPKM